MGSPFSDCSGPREINRVLDPIYPLPTFIQALETSDKNIDRFDSPEIEESPKLILMIRILLWILSCFFDDPWITYAGLFLFYLLS